MIDDARLLRIVSKGLTSELDDWSGDGAVVQRLSKGMNNALYRVEMGGYVYACKLCVPDERRRAVREYNAMQWLQGAGLDLAPRPFGLDESGVILPYPTVVYSWLEGETLGPEIDRVQLEALLASLQRIHACQPQDSPDIELASAWFHWFDLEPYIGELYEFLELYGPWLMTAIERGGELYGRLVRLVSACERFLRSASVDVRRESIPLRLCHVDCNLSNAIWGSDGCLRWVDWEYSGWGDPALDLAEYRWHAASVSLSQTQHEWLRENYVPPSADGSFAERLALWDRLLATRWSLLVLRRLWSQSNRMDRLRLTVLSEDFNDLCARLRRFVERAEQLF